VPAAHSQATLSSREVLTFTSPVENSFFAVGETTDLAWTYDSVVPDSATVNLYLIDGLRGGTGVKLGTVKAGDHSLQVTIPDTVKSGNKYYILAGGILETIFGKDYVVLGESRSFTIVGRQSPVVNMTATATGSSLSVSWSLPNLNNSNANAIERIDDEEFSLYLVATTGGSSVLYLLDQAERDTARSKTFPIPAGLVAADTYSVMITFTTYARQSICSTEQLYDSGNTAIALVSVPTQSSTVKFVGSNPFFKNGVLDVTGSGTVELDLTYSSGAVGEVDVDVISSLDQTQVVKSLGNVSLPSGSTSKTLQLTPSSWGVVVGELVSFRVAKNGNVLAISPSFYLEASRNGLVNTSCLSTLSICTSRSLTCVTGAPSGKVVSLDLCRATVSSSKSRTVQTYCAYDTTYPSIPSTTFCSASSQLCDNSCGDIGGISSCGVVLLANSANLISICSCPYGPLAFSIVILIVIVGVIVVVIISTLSATIHKSRVKRAQKAAEVSAEEAKKRNKQYLQLSTPRIGESKDRPMAVDAHERL